MPISRRFYGSACRVNVDTLSGSGTETQGVALMNMVRTLGLEARAARKVERAPAEVVEDALARLQTILE
ncbi:type II toxin-antitoxin system PemK/MazF family toxin [Paraburkholderia youngii]|uniref:type II toxin-antitoxin system PemK/MazF family toxin n=1 Tax=Paraburkholderia youngii TaxID=2782701 RepID=UPI003D1A6467